MVIVVAKHKIGLHKYRVIILILLIIEDRFIYVPLYIDVYICVFNQSINQSLFSIQTSNNNNIHTFVNMNTERAGNEVMLFI